VLRDVVDLGITHIDTSDYYGPFVTNEIIKEALHPYPESLHIVTKVGARRDAEGGWPTPARRTTCVKPCARTWTGWVSRRWTWSIFVSVIRRSRDRVARRTLRRPRELQEQGLIRHLGLSTVSAEQIKEAQSIAPIVCVQNHYNVAHRVDDDLVDSLADEGIAYVPYFPLGGFTPLQSAELASVATRLDTTSLAVALAWLMQRSSNILLIPGTSSRAHLRDNIDGASLVLSEEDLRELDGIAL